MRAERARANASFLPAGLEDVDPLRVGDPGEVTWLGQFTATSYFWYALASAPNRTTAGGYQPRPPPLHPPRSGPLRECTRSGPRSSPARPPTASGSAIPARARSPSSTARANESGAGGCRGGP